MLVLGRSRRQSVVIGDEITLTVEQIRGGDNGQAWPDRETNGSIVSALARVPPLRLIDRTDLTLIVQNLANWGNWGA